MTIFNVFVLDFQVGLVLVFRLPPTFYIHRVWKDHFYFSTTSGKVDQFSQFSLLNSKSICGGRRN